MASSDEKKSGDLFESTIGDLKDELLKLSEDFGVKVALFCFDDAFSEIMFASAFPSNEKLVYANIGFASSGINSYLEYENDDEEPETKDQKEEVAGKKLVVDALIGEKIGQIKKELCAVRFNAAMKDAKARVGAMNYEELQAVTALVIELTNEVKKRQEALEKEDDDQEI